MKRYFRVRTVLILQFLLLIFISSCNLPGYSTSDWGIEWSGPSNEGAAGWAYYHANGALQDGQIVFVGSRYIIMSAIHDSDLNRLPISATFLINGSATSLGLSGQTSNPVIQMLWTPPMPGQYAIQVRAFRQNDSQDVVTMPMQVCAVYSSDTTIAEATTIEEAATRASGQAVVYIPGCSNIVVASSPITPIATSTVTLWPTIIAATPRPARHNSNGTCSPPPQGCFPYSWIQAQCKCGVP